MKQDYRKILSEILITLKNLNDNVRNCEKSLITICSKLGQMEKEKGNTTTHEIVIKKEIKALLPIEENKGEK